MGHEKELRILLLEDTDYILAMMEDVISMEGHTSFSATLPSQALRILASEEIDLIISDIRMPEMTGIEFGLKIRREGNTLPIIFYSGEANGAYEYKTQLQEMGRASIFDKTTVQFIQVMKAAYKLFNFTSDEQ